MKKHFIISLFLFTLCISTQAQDKKSLKKAIYTTLKAFETKDEKALNSMILKDFGLAIIYRRGVLDNLTITDHISFNQPIPEYLPYDTGFKITAKIYDESLPEFDCEKEQFSKKPGIYTDFNQVDHSLSTIAEAENAYLEANWTPAQLERLKEIEKNSRKVIAYNENGVLIFFLTWVNNQWYLTALDRFEVCSA